MNDGLSSTHDCHIVLNDTDSSGEKKLFYSSLYHIELQSYNNKPFFQNVEQKTLPMKPNSNKPI